jgi:hypothetical protein
MQQIQITFGRSDRYRLMADVNLGSEKALFEVSRGDGLPIIFAASFIHPQRNG